MSTSKDAPQQGRSPDTHRRLLQLDGLRGIAALAVVLFHYTTRFDQLFAHAQPIAVSAPYGYLGVQLFFVISGFVIFMTLERTRAPMDFVVSRFSRLFPTYWTAVLLTAGLLAIMALPGFQPTTRQVTANFSMVQELFGFASIDGVYWSLEIELIFYVWMLALWVTGMLRTPVRMFCLWVSAAMLIRLVGNGAGIWIPHGVSHVLLFNWIAWFALGLAAYLRYREGRATRGVVLLAGLSLLSIGTSEGGAALLPLAMLYLALVVLASMSKASILNWRPLVWLGAISFPLYLVHDKIGWMTMLGLESHGVRSDLAILAALTLSLGAALVVHLLVEKPATRVLRARYKRRRGLKAEDGSTIDTSFSRWRWSAVCGAFLAVAIAGGFIGRLINDRPRPVALGLNAWADKDGAGPQACERLQAAGAQVIAVMGQSNAASHGQKDAASPPVWIYHDGRCGKRRDPLPGTTGTGSSIWSRLGQRLDADSPETAPVVFAPLAIGATRIEHWTSDGPVNAAMHASLAQIAASGMTVRAVVWQQGEADMLYGTASNDYQAALDVLGETLQHYHIDAPVFVAKSTYCKRSGSGAIRRAIDRHLNSRPDTRFRAGPDTDQLLGEARADGCHFSRLGIARAADLWADVLYPVLQHRQD